MFITLPWARDQGAHAVYDHALRPCAEQATEHRGDNRVWRQSAPPLFRPRPFPPPLRCTTSVPTTRPARIEVRRDCGWWHVVLRTLHHADMSAPLTIEQNRQRLW